MYNIGLILVILFFMLLFLGIPISVTIAFSSFVIMLLMLPSPEFSMITAAQVLATGINNSALIAIPFFIFSGCIMNSSGLALRLINFAKLFSFFFRGPLLFINVIANMLHYFLCNGFQLPAVFPTAFFAVIIVLGSCYEK